MTTNNRLPKLPTLSRAKAADQKCQCGCGLLCGNMFRPGHDARLKGGVIALVEGRMGIDEIRAHMGDGYADAVLRTLVNRDRLGRWGISVADAAAKERELAEIAAAEDEAAS